MKNLFYGRTDIHDATALLHFHKKGLTQTLLHELKYRGGQSIGGIFGEWLGNELRHIPSYEDVDLVIPVPLHVSKLRKRGYNQVAAFGNALAQALNASYREDILIKTYSSGSQVFRRRWGRFENEGIFQLCRWEPISGRHILLVDDIVTTGATLEMCASEIWKGNPCKLSLATIAIA